MPDRAAVIAALAEYATKPATAHEVRAEPGEVFSAPPFQQLRQFLPSLRSKAELDALLSEVAALTRTGDPFRTSVIAVNCGSLVEMGGDPALVAPHLVAALPGHLNLARRAAGATFDTDPDAIRARGGLTFLMLATMAVLCRGAAFRQAARANADLVAGVEALAEEHRESGFVAQVLGFTDGLALLVLAPNEGKGFRVACDAVATNAHLFTLLQAALIGGGHLSGEPIDEEVVGVATGAIPHTRVLHDHARFHFSSWFGLPKEGEFQGNLIDSIIHFPVEVSPGAIPEFDGVRVVLIDPMRGGGRSWDSNFFANIHDALRSRAEVVEVLSPEEVTEWLDRIKKRSG
ncbi:hypothetical protein [Frigoriglobus tundricola]|uniref:Uncharacterized protein n=1 Tax=Frigoriglobus tundricola TaxID=2774151 RepID=A0A6M5YLA1_9BACT|nr:hypothetical protein [Frigoriglobus tundricola]QJW94063.1 hypothetical protein FTUN_1582 [Frigoriglobus tundricola]